METLTVSRKVRGHVLSTVWALEVSEGTIPERHKSSYWFKELGSHITSVRKVRVACAWADRPDFHHWEEYIEITTPFGKACVVDFAGGSDLQGAILNDGRPMTLGTWRKYNGKRGHGMSYLRVMAAKKLCKSPERERDVCLAEACARLSGKPWSTPSWARGV